MPLIELLPINADADEVIISSLYESSNLIQCDYYVHREMAVVTFKNGQKYSYYPFTATHHRKLMTAESSGSYFAKNIRLSKDIQCVKGAVEPNLLTESFEIKNGNQ